MKVGKVPKKGPLIQPLLLEKRALPNLGVGAALTAPYRRCEVKSMNDQELPVTIALRQPNGTVEHVRVGTAHRHGDAFTLRLSELTIGVPLPSASASTATAPQAPRPPSSGDPTVFPPYGRSKGMPIANAGMAELEFYANGCRRTLNDPEKARFHNKERALLAVLEAEMARQRGGGSASAGAGYDEEPPPPDDEIPF